jgi:hypothetical protein
MDEGGDAGLYEKWEDRLAKGTPCSCMRGVKFLDPELGEFTDTIDHRGLANAWAANEEKGRMGPSL